MKRIIKFLPILLLLVFYSCGTATKATYGFKIGDSKRIYGKVFQTIDRHQALVENNDILVYVITPADCKVFFYDNMMVRGNFVFIGTYRYKTAVKEYDKYKTVPVFIEKKYYYPGLEWSEENDAP